MATAKRNDDREVFEIEPARTIPAVMGVREVTQYDLTLTKDEADSLLTLFYCHIGGMQRSPALTAIMDALKDAGADSHATDLIRRDTTTEVTPRTGHGMTVLADIFGLDNTKRGAFKG